ncbi:hypothetical protein GCM10010399_77090 [Dactylosporangium fulvum]|uniref:Aminoglycoside phosphotransferase family protein n=1 Tax=Dactylosporangium fulvum TaxID=53359 RepID=A0ABY5W6T7_9ACTN|nr:aminoglycoside phosphotransferase family protein [Dactylosporangium fulvum]UWP85095.1 aminoglycoside phosphotransferase family protein [Dactylosporangium fulvum]
MDAPPAELITEAFGLARPVGGLVPFAFGTSQTWSLDTRDGRVLVKQVDARDWRDDFALAMDFERRVLEAGISMARPLAPAVGFAVEAADGGLLRAYEWVDGRALADTDEVADWLGGTLARLHGIERTGRAGPEWYRLNDEQQWHAWLVEGERQRRLWAPVLRRHLPDVLAAAAWVERGFDGAADHVMTHRDVEPWNVLMTGAGPVLVDWDGAGPDSARLEVVHAAIVFAQRGRPGPDGAAVRRTVRAYAEHGGTAPPADPDVLVRRVGLRLGRLAGRLRMSLGQQPIGPHDLSRIEADACERISGLRAFAGQVAAYAALL